ncbi:hypothetical protein Tco_1546445 [Tanacetum coccineum]
MDVHVHCWATKPMNRTQAYSNALGYSIICCYPDLGMLHNLRFVKRGSTSKVVGEAFTPLDIDSDSDIHEFPLAKDLKDATDYHWVVAHVT